MTSQIFIHIAIRKQQYNLCYVFQFLKQDIMRKVLGLSVTQILTASTFFFPDVLYLCISSIMALA